jgi:hypothetical protein
MIISKLSLRLLARLLHNNNKRKQYNAKNQSK